VLAVARSPELPATSPAAAHDVAFTLIGLVGLADPLRPAVPAAVAQCRAAGIRVVMITGDHPDTARAIARGAGIDAADVVTGAELEALDDDALATRLGQVAVVARAVPAHKLRIIRALQARGLVVGMTGDGVNDAPALRAADIGVAMGLTGTEVAKQAAKVVIIDDDFATIVAAVEEGRVIYRNLKKLILYLFTTSIAEVVILLSALLLGYAPPLLAVQILWINLVTDGMLTITLIMEPAEGDEMQQRPVPRHESILSRSMLVRVAFMVPAMAVSTLGWFVWRQAQGVPFPQVQTETFTVLAVCQWFNVLSCRSERRSALTMSLLRNPWLIGGLLLGNLLQVAVVFFRPLGEVFHTVPIGIETFIAIGAVASLVLFVEELRKFVVRRRASSQPR
jgi:magnesium-transporting ATPase (P-type)